MADMQGRVALVTGASSGIGRSSAEAFAAKGAKVVVAARRTEDLHTLVAEIEASGGEASAIRTDVSQRAAREAARGSSTPRCTSACATSTATRCSTR
jgi:NADP-dependent 3-hydroxy acid dehydrogenase YdfG